MEDVCDRLTDSPLTTTIKACPAMFVEAEEFLCSSIWCRSRGSHVFEAFCTAPPSPQIGARPSQVRPSVLALGELWINL